MRDMKPPTNAIQKSTLLPSSRTQHGLTKSEIVQGMANRFMYSKFYIGLYLVLAILSFVTIVMVSKHSSFF